MIELFGAVMSAYDREMLQKAIDEGKQWQWVAKKCAMVLLKWIFLLPWKLVWRLTAPKEGSEGNNILVRALVCLFAAAFYYVFLFLITVEPVLNLFGLSLIEQ